MQSVVWILIAWLFSVSMTFIPWLAESVEEEGSVAAVGRKRKLATAAFIVAYTLPSIYAIFTLSKNLRMVMKNAVNRIAGRPTVMDYGEMGGRRFAQKRRGKPRSKR